MATYFCTLALAQVLSLFVFSYTRHMYCAERQASTRTDSGTQKYLYLSLEFVFSDKHKHCFVSFFAAECAAERANQSQQTQTSHRYTLTLSCVCLCVCVSACGSAFEHVCACMPGKVDSTTNPPIMAAMITTTTTVIITTRMARRIRDANATCGQGALTFL